EVALTGCHQLGHLLAAVAEVVRLATAAPDVVVAAWVSVRAHPGEVGDVVVTGRHVLSEEDVGSPRRCDELDADRLQLRLDDRLLRRPSRVRRRPRITELRGEAGAGPDGAVTGTRCGGAARAVLLEQGERLRLVVVEDLERA